MMSAVTHALVFAAISCAAGSARHPTVPTTTTVAVFVDAPDPHHRHVRTELQHRLRESLVRGAGRARRAFAVTARNASTLRALRPAPSALEQHVYVAHAVPAAGRTSLDDRLLHPTSATVLEAAQYYADGPHVLSVTAMLSPLAGDDAAAEDDSLTCWVDIDGARHGVAVLRRRSGEAFFALHLAHVALAAGPHRVALVARASVRRGRSRWCSCPSAGDGFQSARHLLAWWSPRPPRDVVATAAAANQTLVAHGVRRTGRARELDCLSHRAPTRLRHRKGREI